MKKIFAFFYILGVMTFSSCGCETVEPGMVGIRVYMMGNRGVDQEMLTVGRYWIGCYERFYSFPTYMQNVRWTEDKTDFSPTDEAIRFQDRNVMTLTADVGFSYTLDSKKIPTLFQRHRKGIEEITNVYLRNIVQNSFHVIGGTMEFSEINGVKKEYFLSRVAEEVNKQISPEGFKIEKVTILALRPPASIMSAVNKRMEAQQAEEQAKSEAAAMLTRAKAEAEASRLKLQALTPLLIQYEAIKKWDGNLPNVMSGNNVPFVNLK